MEPSISNIKEKSGNLKFTLTNTNVSIANAIRRTIINDVESVVFKTLPYEKNNSNFIKNTSRLNNEILKQRLSCIPIHITDIDSFPYKQYIVEVNEKNDTNVIKYVSTEHFKIKDTSTDKYLNENDTKKIFPPDPLTGDYVVFTRLRPRLSDDIPGEEIQFTCKLDIGSANEDSMFNCVSTCAYGMTPDLVEINKQWTNRELKLKKDGVSKEDIDFEKSNFMNLDAKRYTQENSFDFNIESVGVFKNKFLFKKGCELLINKLKSFESAFEKNTVIINKSDTLVEHCYEIILQDEDYTIGKTFEYILYTQYFEKKDVLSFCGFKKHHPHDSYSIVRIAFKENTELSEIYAMCIEMCKYGVKLFEKINSAMI